jgi:hypothetical protein
MTIPADWGTWGALALLVALSAADVAYAVAVARRAWAVARQGPSGVRAHPGPLIGLVGGLIGLIFATAFLAAVWRAGAGMGDALFRTHSWASVPALVGGYAFGYTGRARQPSELDRAMLASVRAHPRQALAAFVIAFVTWMLLPLAGWLPANSVSSARLIFLFLWPLALLAEMVIGFRLARRIGVVTLSDSARTRRMPMLLLSPWWWGWLAGTVLALLLFAALGQMQRPG